MTTRGLGILISLWGLALPSLSAAEDLGEGKPFEKLSEAKPAAKDVVKSEAKPRRAAAAAPIDYLDFVFAANDRPVLLRLHLRNGNRPYTAGWDDYLKKFYDYFDRNGDGILDKAEAERAPNTQFLQFHLQGSIGFGIQGQTVKMPQMDTNKDGKVSRAEFAAYYARGGFRALEFANNNNRAGTDTVTNTLLKRLDANKDGKLSADELAKAPDKLARLDLDEDEMITAAELTPGGDNPYGGVVFTAPAAGMAGGPNADMGFLEVKPGAADAAARQVLALYDKDKNGKLSRTEIGLDKALFDRLDADRDGQLDGKEFAGFFQRDADLELLGRIGNVQTDIANFFRKIGLGGSPLRAEIFNPTKRDMPLAAKVHRHDPAALGFGLGDANIDLSVSDQTFAQFSNVKNFYVRQFKQADTDKKGVIDLKKAKTAQFLEQIFPLADRDGDGKLTEKELNAYLDMQVEGSGARMQLTITDEGRSLFDLLDENADSRLAVRELRSAWTRIKPLAKSAEGLARQDIPRRLQVTVGPSQGRRFRSVTVSRRGTAPAASKSEPLWFKKMDRNHDGDISVREFLGSAEDFRKLDADGDCLISVEEARQFEAKLAKAKEAKR